MRRANGLARAAVVAGLLVLPGHAAASTSITTVAGGGTAAVPQAGAGNPAATDVVLTAPNSVSQFTAGDGDFTVTDANCVPERVDAPADADSGPMGYLAGQRGTCTTGAPPTATIGSNPFDISFANPCCLRGWGSGTWMLANNPANAARIEWYNGAGKVKLLAGGDSGPAGGCGTSPAPTDNGDPLGARFCQIKALAVGTSLGSYVIGEMGRQSNGNGNIYEVQGDLFPGPQTIQHLSGAIKVAGLAYTPYGTILAADGVKQVWRVSDGSVTSVAGTFNFPPGFGGDGDEAQYAFLNQPTAIAVGHDQAWYIADKENCRVRRVSDLTPAGIISTIAGRDCLASAPAGDQIGDGGASTAAYLHKPTDLAVVPSGLLIADTGNNRIRFIDRTSITSSPKSGVEKNGVAVLADATPSFEFASLDVPPRFRCRLNGGAAFDCPSPFTLPAAADGNYLLEVWENGHDVEPDNGLFFSSPPDPTPATTKFMVDTTGPVAFALREPATGAASLPGSPVLSWDEASDDPAGVAGYELWVDGTKNRDVAPSACLGGICTAEPAAPLSEGDHRWQVRAVDSLGHAQTSEERTFNVGGPPVAAFTIGPNPALAGRTVTFDASGSSDPSGIGLYEWDLDGDGSFETNAGASPVTTRSYPAPATIPITLRVTDGAGKTATAPTQSLRVTTGQGTQNLVGVSINSGAQYTRTPDVTLLVNPPPTANAIIVSNDGGFLAPATFPSATSIKWKLDSSGPERLPKTVYVRFRLGPIVSDNFTDDIILDETPPVVQQAALLSAPIRGSATAAARARTFRLRIRATDSNSGVFKVQATADKRKPGRALPYRRTLSVKSAKRPKFVRAQDRAGNFSRWKKLR